MKLFKNGVGRPSNEVKEARRVFVISVIAIIISVITLLICLLTKFGVLTSKLEGKVTNTNSRVVNYDVWEDYKDKVTIDNWPDYKKYASDTRVKFPERPDFKSLGNYKCDFTGWIFQKNDDEAFRVRLKNGSYTWLKNPEENRNFERYAFFNNTGYKLNYNMDITLHAAFDCEVKQTQTNVKNTKVTIQYKTDLDSSIGKPVPNQTCYRNSSECKIPVYDNKDNGTVDEVLKFRGWYIYRLVNGEKRYFKNYKDKNNKQKKGFYEGIENAFLFSQKYPSLLIKNHNVFKHIGKDIESITLTAVASWKEEKATKGNIRFIFDGNGATSGSMKSQEIKHSNNTKQLTSNAYKRKSYAFAGWKAYRYTKENGKYVKKYFVGYKDAKNDKNKVKGFTISNKNSSDATLISNKGYIFSGTGNYRMSNHIGYNAIIFLEAQWKKTYQFLKSSTGGNLGKFDPEKDKFPAPPRGYVWKIYRIDVNKDGSPAYWNASKNNWTGTEKNTKMFTQEDPVKIIMNSTGDGAIIYLEAVECCG